jgi:hypothetical protein
MAALVNSTGFSSILEITEDTYTINQTDSQTNTTPIPSPTKKIKIKEEVAIVEPNVHSLNRKWILWSHLPQNPDWTIKSYNKICSLNTLEDVVAVLNIIPDI